MIEHENKNIVGIFTDEEAMYSLLEKFFVKEGFDVRRVSRDRMDEEFSFVIYAPTRDLARSEKWFGQLTKKQPTFIIAQTFDDDMVEAGDNVVVISERPLNLQRLSNTIKMAMEERSLNALSQEGQSDK